MRAMAGAGRPLLLLCVVAALLPVQGFIPIQFHRPGKGDVDGWRRSGTAGGSGDVHPMPHLPPKFKHRFVHRPSKSLLEEKEGEPHGFEIHPQWERHFHRQHHGEDFTLAGERHRHRRDHAHFKNHHDKEALPERMMREHGVEEHHGHALHFKEHERYHKKHVSRSGVWENMKATMGDSVSSLADRLQSVGDGIKNWFTQSKSRVAPTISFSAEPTWLGRLVSEPARASPTASGSCNLDTKLVAVVNGVLSEESLSEPQKTCAGMVEARTKLLKASLIRELKSLCSGNLDAPCELQFCDFFNGHAKVAAFMVMSKFHVNPVAVALKQDTSSLCTGKDTRDLLHHIHHVKRRLHFQAGSIASEGTDTCQVCVDRSLKNVKHDFKNKLEQLCEKATCPKLRDSCAFVKEHKHLARTLFILKLRPWEMVADSCASTCGTTAFPDVLSGSRVQKDSAVDESSKPSLKWVRLAKENPFRALRTESSFPLHHQHHLGSGCNRQAMQMRVHEAIWQGDVPEIQSFAHADGTSHPHLVVVEFVRHRGVDSVFADVAKSFLLELAAKGNEVTEGSIKVDSIKENIIKEDILNPLADTLMKGADERVDKQVFEEVQPVEELRHSDI